MKNFIFKEGCLTTNHIPFRIHHVDVPHPAKAALTPASAEILWQKMVELSTWYCKHACSFQVMEPPDETPNQARLMDEMLKLQEKIHREIAPIDVSHSSDCLACDLIEAAVLIPVWGFCVSLPVFPHPSMMAVLNHGIYRSFFVSQGRDTSEKAVTERQNWNLDFDNRMSSLSADDNRDFIPPDTDTEPNDQDKIDNYFLRQKESVFKCHYKTKQGREYTCCIEKALAGFSEYEPLDKIEQNDIPLAFRLEREGRDTWDTLSRIQPVFQEAYRLRRLSKLQPSTLPTSLESVDEMSGITCPEGTQWEHIVIRFRKEDTVVVKFLTNGQEEVCSMQRMGMANERNNYPTKKWELLKLFAEYRGHLTFAHLKADPSLKSQKQQLDKGLREFFGLSDTAFRKPKPNRTFNVKLDSEELNRQRISRADAGAYDHKGYVTRFQIMDSGERFK